MATTSELIFGMVGILILTILVVISSVEMKRHKRQKCSAEEIDVGITTDIVRSGRASMAATLPIEPLGRVFEPDPVPTVRFEKGASIEDDPFQQISEGNSAVAIGPKSWREKQKAKPKQDDNGTNVEWNDVFQNFDTSKNSEFAKSVPTYEKALKAANSVGAIYTLDAVDRAASGCRQGCGAKVQSPLSLPRNIGISTVAALRPALPLPQITQDACVPFNSSDAFYQYTQNVEECVRGA